MLSGFSDGHAEELQAASTEGRGPRGSRLPDPWIKSDDTRLWIRQQPDDQQGHQERTYSAPGCRLSSGGPRLLCGLRSGCRVRAVLAASRLAVRPLPAAAAGVTQAHLNPAVRTDAHPLDAEPSSQTTLSTVHHIHHRASDCCRLTSRTASTPTQRHQPAATTRLMAQPPQPEPDPAPPPKPQHDPARSSQLRP